MATDLQSFKGTSGQAPWYTLWTGLIDAIQSAVTSNEADIAALQAGAGEAFVGQAIQAASAPPNAVDYVGPIPYPGGLTGLSNTTYPELAALFGGTSTLWAEQSSGTSSDLSAVAYAGDGYVATAGANQVQRYSLDGVNWQAGLAGSFSTGGAPLSVACNTATPDVIIAVGTDNSIWKSTTGIGGLFNQITSPLTNFSPNWVISDIKAAGSEAYCAVAYRQSGTLNAVSAVLYTIDDGDTWTVVNSNLDGLYRAIQVDPISGVVAIAGAGKSTLQDNVFYTVDLVNWYSGGSITLEGALVDIYDINVLNGLWYVCGSNGAIFYTAASVGFTWVRVPIPESNTLRFVRIDTANNNVVFGGDPANGRAYIYTWDVGENPPVLNVQNTGAGVTLYDYAENGLGQSVIVGGGGKIYTFAAFGGDFSAGTTVDITGNAGNVVSIAESAAEILALRVSGTNVIIYSSDDGGATFSLAQTIATGLETLDTTSSSLCYDSVNGLFILCAVDSVGTPDTKIFTFPDSATTAVARLTLSGSGRPYHLATGGGVTLLVAESDSASGFVYAGYIWRSTDGGLNWSGYVDATANCDRNSAQYLGGYFVIALSAFAGGSDGGKLMYSTTGEDGSWALEAPDGVTTGTNSIPQIGYANGYFWYKSNADNANIYRSATINGTWSALALAGGVTFSSMDWRDKMYSDYGVLITKTSLGASYSVDGQTWEAIAGSPSLVYYNQKSEYGGKIRLLESGSDDITDYNYTANNAPNTFNIPYPAEGEAPAPWQYYVRAFQ
jgi:hypothetical protein